MQLWYLTPASISYLTQFILAFVIAAYLLQRLRRRENRSAPTVWLTGFFALITLFIGLMFLDAASPPTQRLYAVFLETPVLGAALVCLLQFAYHFPALSPRRKWEAYTVLALSVLYTLWETQFALFRFSALSSIVHFRPHEMDYALAIGFLWVPVAFLRQAVAADDRPVAWWRKVWRPQGLGARGARAFALIYLLTAGLSLVNVLRALAIFSTALYNLSLSIGILAALWLFAMAYLNYLPETTSFMVKLAGVTLALLLAVLGAVGWVMTPTHAATFQPGLPAQQTLRFSPNTSGGYVVSAVPIQFDSDLGTRLAVRDTDEEPGSAAVDFQFLFCGQAYSKIYVGDNGAIGLGQRVRYQDIQYHYGFTPALFPLYLDLDPEPSPSGVFARQADDRLILSWNHVRNFYQPDAEFTFQATLHANGEFEFSYADLPANVAFRLDDYPQASVWLIGAVRGDPALAPQAIDFAALSSPLQIGAAGFVQDYYLAFRRYLHQSLLPLAQLIIASALLIILGLPVFVHSNLVKPLDALLVGVRQVDAGNLQVAMPVQYRDEIGFLTESFNTMVRSWRLEQVQRRQTETDLQDLAASLEARVADRTRELSALFALLAIAAREQNLQVLLSESLARTMTALRCDTGAILLVNENKNEAEPTRLRIAAHQGFPPDLPTDREMQPSANGLFAWMCEQRQPALISDLSTDPRVPAAMRALGTRALLIAPVQAGDQVLGILGLLRAVEQRFSREEIALLATIADQLGIAVQSHHLRQRAERSAVLEERQRLARDLHDSVTQSLYSVTLFAQASRSSAGAGNLSLTQQYISRLSEMAQQTLKEMRWLIYELRPALVEEVGLVNALQRRLEMVERRAGIEAQFVVEGMGELEAALENTVYQIAQEALNNILKHSAATYVTLRMSMDGHDLRLEIQDNGRGFDPNSVGETAGIGLASMQERAAQLGGVLAINSKPGRGTRIALVVPHGGGVKLK